MADLFSDQRSNEPVMVFQDQVPHNQHMNSHAPMPHARPAHRRILGSADANATFRAPQIPQIPSTSPSKSKSIASTPAIAPFQVDVPDWLKPQQPLMPPSHSPDDGHFLTDSHPRKPYLSNFKTSSQPSGPPFDLASAFDINKENVYPQKADFSVEVFNVNPNGNGKRGLMEAAPIKEARPAKKQKTVPPACHSGTLEATGPAGENHEKPQQSYSQLIASAILSSEHKRLTLAQIYSNISERYPYYRQIKEGWQNSIRHNLSLHKHFIKIDRPKDDPGKGSYWAIQPGQEGQFLKEKPSRKAAATAENIPVMSTRLEPSDLVPGRPATAPAPTVQQRPAELNLPPPVIQFSLHAQPTGHRRNQSSASLAIPNELSSDATIPFSDGAIPNDGDDRAADVVDLPPHSPALGGLHSSPPVSRAAGDALGSPSPLGVARPSSHQGLSKNTCSSLTKNDSGYYSSMNSSAMRPPTLKMSRSETEAPQRHRSHRKEGRAEAAIMRMRNSTPTSPTQSRSRSAQRGLLESSPLARAGTVVKSVARNDPSLVFATASPTTNLRIHRANLSRKFGSPVRPFDSSLQAYSPLKLEELPVTSNFEDALNFEGNLDLASSPIKRTGRLNRTVSTPNLTSKQMRSERLQHDGSLLHFSHIHENLLDTPSRAFEPDTPSRFLIQSPLKGFSADDSVAHLSSLEDWLPENFSPSDLLGVNVVDGDEGVENFLGDQTTGTQVESQGHTSDPAQIQDKLFKTPMKPASHRQPPSQPPRSRLEQAMLNMSQPTSGYDISLGFAKIGAKSRDKGSSHISTLR